MKLLAVAIVGLLPCLASTMDIDKGKAIGNPSAPIRIDIFSDFQCPSCRNLHIQVLPLLIRDYASTGKVYLVSREFPLPIPAHKYNREAANYATAAARIGKYFQVADALFLTQPEWDASGKVWEAVAKVLTPAEQKKVQAMAHDPGVLAEVQADVDFGNSLRVSQTPTVFVTQGTKRYSLPGAFDYGLFRSMIDGLLK